MKTKLYIFLSFIIFSLTFIPEKVIAASTIPNCGNDFSNSVELQEGENIGGSISEGNTCYYYINVNSGYELDIDYKLTGEHFFGSVKLYDNDKNEIAGSIDAEDVLKWLGSGSEQSKYYLVLESSYNIDSQTIKISKVDRTDANSNTDAGGDFDSSLDIEYGEYTGYLSSFTYGAEGGNDEADYYKLAVKKGDKLTVKITPAVDFEAGCAVYDSNRSELFNEEGLDLEAGEIIQKEFDIQSDGYIYIVAKKAFYGKDSDEINQYTLKVTNENIDSLGGEVDEEEEGKENGTGGITLSTRDILIRIFSIILVVLVIALIIYLIIHQSKKKKQSPNKISPPVSTKKSKPKITKNIDHKKTLNDEKLNKVRVTVEEGTEVEVKTVDTDKTGGSEKQA